jgi:hypothetical protein
LSRSTGSEIGAGLASPSPFLSFLWFHRPVLRDVFLYMRWPNHAPMIPNTTYGSDVVKMNEDRSIGHPGMDPNHCIRTRGVSREETAISTPTTMTISQMDDSAFCGDSFLCAPSPSRTHAGHLPSNSRACVSSISVPHILHRGIVLPKAYFSTELISSLRIRSFFGRWMSLSEKGGPMAALA